jgi:hypothetical protein
MTLRQSARCAALLAALTVSSVSLARAQSLRDQTQPAASLAGPTRVLSTNPFLPLFGYFSGEYEQRVKPNVALALSGSHIEFDERYTHLDAKIRLYPNDRALQGFNMATSLGMAWIRRDNQSCDFFECQTPTKRTISTPTFAIEGAYQWLLGSSKSTVVTAGFGAKRYLGGSQADFRGISRVLPTGRLSIGYGF